MAKAKKVEKVEAAGKQYEKPEVKVLQQGEILKAVKKGSKFPARGFAG
jgi:hypothetical protein